MMLFLFTKISTALPHKSEEGAILRINHLHGLQKAHSTTKDLLPVAHDRMKALCRKPVPLLLCCAIVLVAHTACALDDFGQHIVEETVDLSTAHNEDDAEKTQDMESLLHWAIGAARAGRPSHLQLPYKCCISAFPMLCRT
jgi:hypothetical protein